MRRIQALCLLAMSTVLFFLPSPVCSAQCWNYTSNGFTLSASPEYWAPGQSYNVVITSSIPNFTNGTSPLGPLVLTAAAYNTGISGGPWAEDPNVVVTNPAYISPTQISFTVTVASGAPIEDDGFALSCYGTTVADGPDFFFITPCANTPPAPVISSVSPSAFFAGETTSITITGSNFIPNNNPNGCVPTAVDTFTADEDVITGADVVSPTEITATVAPEADETDLSATVWVGNLDENSGSEIVATTNASVLPAPAIQWTNPSTNTTSDISVTSGKPTVQSAVVGWLINPTVDSKTLPSGVTITQSVWTVTGTNIGGYTPTNDSGLVTATTTTTTTPNLTTYWPYPSTKGSPFQITYSYCVDVYGLADPCSPAVIAEFNVTGPSGGKMTFTPYSSVVSIANLSECNTSTENYPGGPYLVYATSPGGTACPNGLYYDTPGITFGNPTKYQNSSGGTFSLVQLISNDVINGTTYGPGLDTAYPYPEPPPTIDNPDLLLPATPTTVNRDFTANMFLMWTSSTPNSIPVPLGYQTWGFNGTATCSGSCGTYTNWTPTTTGKPGPMGSFTPSTASQTQVGNNTLVYGYPTWNSVTN